MKVENKTRAPSIWDPPNQRYFNFLKRVENSGLPKSLAILGCSDGNYVLPAAKRGFDVLAIDTDATTLFGGTTLIQGKELEVVGLARRLETEGVENCVTIVHDDCFSYNTTDAFSGVFTSGSIHYQQNYMYTTEQIMDSIQSYVSSGGLLLLEYIHRSEENNDSSRHFLTADEIANFFPSSQWKLTSNKKKKYTEKPNPRNDHIHDIVWGRLYVKKRP